MKKKSCEGIEANVVFSSPTKRKHKRAFCCKSYSHCRMIIFFECNFLLCLRSCRTHNKTLFSLLLLLLFFLDVYLTKNIACTCSMHTIAFNILIFHNVCACFQNSYIHTAHAYDDGSFYWKWLSKYANLFIDETQVESGSQRSVDNALHWCT